MLRFFDSAPTSSRNHLLLSWKAIFYHSKFRFLLTTFRTVFVKKNMHFDLCHEIPLTYWSRKNVIIAFFQSFLTFQQLNIYLDVFFFCLNIYLFLNCHKKVVLFLQKIHCNKKHAQLCTTWSHKFLVRSTWIIPLEYSFTKKSTAFSSDHLNFFWNFRYFFSLQIWMNFYFGQCLKRLSIKPPKTTSNSISYEFSTENVGSRSSSD